MIFHENITLIKSPWYNYLNIIYLLHKPCQTFKFCVFPFLINWVKLKRWTSQGMLCIVSLLRTNLMTKAEDGLKGELLLVSQLYYFSDLERTTGFSCSPLLISWWFNTSELDLPYFRIFNLDKVWIFRKSLFTPKAILIDL